MRTTPLFRALALLVLPLLLVGIAACGGGAGHPGGGEDGGAAPATGAGVAGGRDQIRIVGSSTVYPFATRVAEQFGRGTDFKTPIIESTGTGGGFKLFCAGIGIGYPDISNASRAIKPSEVETCKANGVTEIVEVKIGYDGIVVANARSSRHYDLSRRDLFTALARELPAPGGGFVPNPNKTWQDVNPDLPPIAIEVLGPPPTSGTRDAFAELVMEAGCKSYEEIEAVAATDKDRHKALCQAIREDGAWTDAGENDNLIVQKLVASPDALGVFGYSFLEENLDQIQGSTIDGVEANFDNIASGQYPISRPLFFYVKAAHAGVIPGIGEYVDEFVSDAAVGEDGYLTEVGLIPLPAAERAVVRGDATSLTPNVG